MDRSHPLLTEAPQAIEIPAEIETLQSLALRGSWLKILTTTTPTTPNPPNPNLILLTFHIISLTKLRRFSEALTTLESTLPNLTTSPNPIPFSLRWLHALLPSFLSRRSESLDRLYLLLSFTRSYPPSPTWIRRQHLVISTLISLHSSHKEFLVAIKLLQHAISVHDNFNNVDLLSKLGYVQLQFGDVDAAKSTFLRVESIVAARNNASSDDLNLVGKNRALVYLVGKDYVSAVREYDECISRDETDVVSINNKALCLMYLRDLSDSIKVLETSLERVPTVALNETLIVNLCSMYELAYVNHTDIKKTLSNWIARLAPDDFDSSSTRV